MAYVAFMICRVVYVALNWTAFHDGLFQNSWSDLLAGSLLFDTSALLYLNALYLLLMLLPIHLKEHARYHRVVRIVYLVFNGIGIIANLADAVYFPFTGRRTTATVFSEFSNEGNLGDIVGTEILHSWYLVLLFVVLIWAMYKLYVLPCREEDEAKPIRLRNYYPTLTAALQAISTIGMDGAVEIAVEPGTYTEQVTLPEISGAGAANTITIRSLSGKYNDVTYQYNNTLTAEKGVFTIDGADYVTLKGLSFTSTYTSNQNPAVVVVRNAATHVTIDSCRIYAERMTEYTMRLDLLSVDAGENNYNNDFALTNSVLEGGYMGLHVTGHKAAADPLQQNMLISRNTFRNQGNQMLYGDAVSKLQVLNNTFRTEVKKSNCAAIDWLLIGDTAVIAGNDIYMTAEASDNLNYQALYFRPNSYQDKENAVLFVINNTIYAANASTYASYAVNLNSNLPKLLVAHNTIVLNAEGTAASPVYIQSAPVAGSLFVNNIIQASGKGYAIRYKNAGSIANTVFRHNILYTRNAPHPERDQRGPSADCRSDGLRHHRHHRQDPCRYAYHRSVRVQRRLVPRTGIGRRVPCCAECEG